MIRVVVGGLCPLPFENTSKSFGPGIRSWQFASSLVEDGHEVRLLAMEIPGSYEGGRPPAEEEVGGVQIRRLDEPSFRDEGALARAVGGFAPEVLVGATIYGSNAVCRLPGALPLWADQFGHVMAEAQAKAALDGDNKVLPYFWRMVKRVDRRADRFSVVSDRQRYALIGELGALGRLGAETCGYEFVDVIPCAIVPATLQRDLLPLRGQLVPADAFVVLWSGSYNVWSDVETLFRGLEAAMREEPRIHFVSTGGAIEGHDELTYARLQELIAGSAVGERFHLQGWVPADHVPSFQALADLGVLSEKPIYEGTLGSKNRVVQWLAHGPAVLYNRYGDLGDLLALEGLGLTFEPGDAESLTQQLLWACRNPDELAETALRGRQYATGRLSFAATTRALRQWVARPTVAPDRALVKAGLEDPDGHASRLRNRAASLAERRGGASSSLRRLRNWLARAWA